MSFLGDLFGAGSGALAGAALGPFGAIAGGVLGLLGSESSNQASRQQQNAAQNAINTQMQMYQQNRADLMPWTQAGGNANNALMQALGLAGGQFDPNAPLLRPFTPSDLTTDPSYQWRLNQGLQGVTNRASALGGLGGSNTMHDLINYAGNSASQEYQNAFARYNQNQQNIYNRLAGISGMGESAAGQQAGLGANTAANVGGLQYAQGQAQAGGTLGGANALLGLGGNLMNNWLYANALQQGGFTQPASMPPQFGTGTIGDVPLGGYGY